MQRRTLLGAVGAAVAAAGCVESVGSRGGTPTEDDPGTDGNGTMTDDPKNGTAANPFAGDPCPSFAENADWTVCAHAVDQSSADVYPTVTEPVFAPTTGDGEVETTSFVLRNGSDRSLGLNPYDWAIKRRTDGDWEHVAPDAAVEPWTYVEPGEAYTWVLSVEDHPTPQSDRTRQVVQDLPSGTYAFQITGLVGEQDQQETASLEAVWLFEVRRD